MRRDLSGGLTSGSAQASYSKYYLLEAGPIALDDGKNGDGSGKQGMKASPIA